MVEWADSGTTADGKGGTDALTAVPVTPWLPALIGRVLLPCVMQAVLLEWDEEQAAVDLAIAEHQGRIVLIPDQPMDAYQGTVATLAEIRGTRAPSPDFSRVQVYGIRRVRIMSEPRWRPSLEVAVGEIAPVPITEDLAALAARVRRRATHFLRSTSRSTLVDLPDDSPQRLADRLPPLLHWSADDEAAFLNMLALSDRLRSLDKWLSYSEPAKRRMFRPRGFIGGTPWAFTSVSTSLS